MCRRCQEYEYAKLAPDIYKMNYASACLRLKYVRPIRPSGIGPFHPVSVLRLCVRPHPCWLVTLFCYTYGFCLLAAHYWCRLSGGLHAGAASICTRGVPLFRAHASIGGFHTALPYGDARLMSLKIGIHPFPDDIVFRLKNFT